MKADQSSGPIDFSHSTGFQIYLSIAGIHVRVQAVQFKLFPVEVSGWVPSLPTLALASVYIGGTVQFVDT